MQQLCLQQRRIFCVGNRGGGGGGGGAPTGWLHTAESGEPDCQGPEAKPYQRDTLSAPISGGAQCLDQSMGFGWIYVVHMTCLELVATV